MHKLDDTLPRVVWIRCDPLLRSIFLGRFPPGYSPRDIPRTTLFLVFALRLISFLYEAASRRRNGRQGGTRLRTPDEPILNASHESNVKYIFKKKRMLCYNCNALPQFLLFHFITDMHTSFGINLQFFKHCTDTLTILSTGIP